MSKNPFVNCKSRKRRKVRAPIVKPAQEKLFCPRTMVRYDNSPTEYSTVWVCKMCLVCMLSEDAVRKHLITCNASTKKNKVNPAAKKNENTHYICETCKKVFSRRVTLKKHLEEHEKSSSSMDSEQSDDEVEEMDETEEVDEVDEADLLSAENEDDDDESEEEQPCCSSNLT